MWSVKWRFRDNGTYYVSCFGSDKQAAARFFHIMLESYSVECASLIQNDSVVDYK